MGFTVSSKFYFFLTNKQDLFPIIVTTKHLGGEYMSVMLFVVLWIVSLLQRKIIHLILLF